MKDEIKRMVEQSKKKIDSEERAFAEQARSELESFKKKALGSV